MRRNFWTMMACCSVLALLVGCYGSETYPGPPAQPLPTANGDVLPTPSIHGEPVTPPPERLPPRPTNVKPDLDPQYLLFREGGMLYLSGDSHLDKQLDGDFTIELWVKMESTNNQEILRANGMKIGIRTGHLRARIAGRELFGLKIVDDEWYHVSLVAHKQSIRFYVNGHLHDQLDTNGTWTRPTAPFIMGLTTNLVQRDQEANLFVGAVDNLRLISAAIHTGDFMPKQYFEKNDLLVFGFSFDGLTGAAALDHSSNGYNAMLFGPISMVPGAI